MAISAQLRGFQDLSAQQWLDRISKTVPQAVSLLLVVAIAWQLVQLTWLLLDRGAPETPAAVVAPAAAANQSKGPDVQAIVNAHLFGQPESKTAGDPVNAPQTQMNLVLSAVFATNDAAKGWAIIGESPTNSNVFMLGETVRSGTKLHAVYADRVILERDGKLEALALPTLSLGGVMPKQAAARPSSSQFTENLRRIAETNPTAFTEIVRPQPVFANGVQRGYRVYPGRSRQQFARLGLQPGDLVTAINGTPLDDPQRGLEVFNTMSSSDRVTVSVERNGQTQDLTLNTAQISLPDSAAPGPSSGTAPGTNRGSTPPPSPGADGPQTE